MSNTEKYLIIGIAIVLLVYFCTKFKTVRIITGVVVYLGICFTGIISFGHIDNYYSASGGVYGEITDLLRKNTVTKVEEKNDLTLNFSNIVLTKNNEYYSFEVLKTETMQFNQQDDLIVYINDFPCEVVAKDINEEHSYILVKFTYAFFDRDINGKLILIKEDTLQAELDFFKNNTKIKIFIFNGDDTNSLWNMYFSKNSLELALDKITNNNFRLTPITEDISEEGEL